MGEFVSAFGAIVIFIGCMFFLGQGYFRRQNQLKDEASLFTIFPHGNEPIRNVGYRAKEVIRVYCNKEGIPVTVVRQEGLE